jgi:GTPase SAR1 family protein
LDGQRGDIAYFYPDEERPYLDERIKIWKALHLEIREHSVYLLGFSDGEFHLTPFEIKPPTVELGLIYGEEFLPVNQRIIARLSEKKSKGLVILYGPPGTGKTTYMRYMIGRLADTKKVVYLPPDVAKELASPSFLPFLTHHPDSILIIEDAENIVRERSGQNHHAVANLLNLSDGILSDCLSIQVVCSFNSDLTRVDPALLRKGRLIAKHRFDKIPVDRAQKIVDLEGLGFTVTEPMTLAEIYYYHDEIETPNKSTPIGFGKR